MGQLEYFFTAGDIFFPIKETFKVGYAELFLRGGL